MQMSKSVFYYTPTDKDDDKELEKEDDMSDDIVDY